MAATYNRDNYDVFNNFTYVFCGDGCLQEGVSSEACSLAGHLGLGKLIVLYDDNHITIDGDTDLSFTEDVGKRYESYGWQVIRLEDTEVTEQLDALRAAIDEAKAETSKPTLIKIKTVIGYGSTKANSHSVHGAPLGGADLATTKTKYGLDPEKMFQVDDDVREVYSARVSECEQKVTEWETMYSNYQSEYPELASELERRFKHEMPAGVLEEKLPSFIFGKDKADASRKYSSKCLNAIAGDLPELIGGSADLTPSNLTNLGCTTDFQKDTPEGRYLRFGVREHGMAAICNGLFAYGFMRPFCATFFNFAGYALGAIRVSALSKFGIIYIMTHDSIGLGEDGPTHQPVEMFESIRSMPNINLMRPADMNETSACYAMALENHETPTVICLSRQGLPAVENSSSGKTKLGGYVISEVDDAKLTLVGTGGELHFCIDAAKVLNENGVPTRVVSMPCMDIFFEQSMEYQRSVLTPGTACLSVEASAVHGWHRISHAQIGMTRFGASAPYKDLAVKFGFTVENVVEKGKALVGFYSGRNVPDLLDRPILDNVQKGAHDH